MASSASKPSYPLRSSDPCGRLRCPPRTDKSRPSRSAARPLYRAPAGIRTHATPFVAADHASSVVGDKPKAVWVETTNVQVLLSAIETGLSTTALFNRRNAELAQEWRRVGRFTALTVCDDGVISQGDQAIGVMVPVEGPEDVDGIGRLAGVEPLVVMDSSAWQVIPAENLVAVYSATRESRLMAVATTTKDAEAMFEALEMGTDGVVLRTDDPAETRSLAAYIAKRRLMSGIAQPGDSGSGADENGGDGGSARLKLSPAIVTRVETVGVGDRVCVDCASAFAPGEGLLVGSFAKGLFLVHSECLQAQGYLNSRPFRVNAGPLCSYCLLPGGRTAYLSELKAGDDVLCVDRNGETNVKTVGRVKVEQRQMVLVEAESEEDGCTFVTLLQNAETVKLVSAGQDGGRPGATDESGDVNVDKDEDGVVSVSVLDPGDRVLVHRLAGARHTGLTIAESRWYER